MAEFERVRFKSSQGVRTIYLRHPRTRGPFLVGVEVDRQGDELAPRGVDERRHVIALSTVRRRTPMVLDRKYTELVPG